MGVKDFTKVFEPECEIKYSGFKGKNIVIDASVEIYRAALGMQKINTLTDDLGNPTGHINVILLNILSMKAHGANQYWIFDYNDAKKSDDDIYHNPLKQLELQKRKQKKTAANKKIEELKEKMSKLKTDKDELFSESEEETDDEELSQETIKKENKKEKQSNSDKIDSCQKEIHKQEKAAFRPGSFYFDDIKFVLDMLEIPWVECPCGFDAEQIAAFATNINIFDKLMDYVFTSDADCLLFGAKQLIKRDIKKKKFFLYNLQNILKEHNLDQKDLIKIGLILGTDFAPKSAGIGPKTVLKKYKKIELTEQQLNAYNQNFMRTLTEEELKTLKNSIHNVDSTPFSNKEKFTQLLDWLELVKKFNRSRIENHFTKKNLFV